MEEFQYLSTFAWFLPVIILLVIWEAIWKIMAMWRSARNNQLGWFLCIAIFNTIGILSIIYLLTHKKSAEVIT